MTTSTPERSAAQELQLAFRATQHGTYDRRSSDRIAIRAATLAFAAECRRKGMPAEQTTDEIRSIAASVGLYLWSPSVSDAVRWCIALYFDVPLHD